VHVQVCLGDKRFARVIAEDLSAELGSTSAPPERAATLQCGSLQVLSMLYLQS
jgi:hypothetical protein